MPPPTAASKRSVAPVPPGDRLELRPVMRDDVLVGGHDALAHRQGRGDQRVRRLVAAHQLDDDVDPLVGDEVRRGIGQQLGGDAGGDRPARVANGDRDELERGAVGRAQLVGAVQQGGDDLATDGPGAEDRDAQARTAHDGLTGER